MVAALLVVVCWVHDYTVVDPSDPELVEGGVELPGTCAHKTQKTIPSFMVVCQVHLKNRLVLCVLMLVML
eukprot:COSAG06_NODE_24990_length_647_cov_66.089416_1_plen_69_part_10